MREGTRLNCNGHALCEPGKAAEGRAGLDGL